MKYFISYTTRDKEITRNFLEAFSLRLKRKGEVFVDLIDNNSADRQARVIHELDSCNLFILIETENIYKSNWVTIEIERAKSRNIPIHKVKIEDIRQMSAEDIFDSIDGLSNR